MRLSTTSNCIPFASLLAAASFVIADGFIYSVCRSTSSSILLPSIKSESASTSPTLQAQIYMPDGSVVQDDNEDWMETEKSQTSNALLKHLNGPGMRGPLAVLAAADKDIDITTIESVSVQAVTSSAIHIEAICSSEDMHCVNVLASIDFPVDCNTDSDKGILDACGVLYEQATAKLEEKKVKTGTVVSFNSGRGFGFIATDDGSDDVYVHYTNIMKDGFKNLDKGERVEFKAGVDTKRGTGKPYAYDVTPLGSEQRTSAADESVHAELADETGDGSISYDDATELAYEESGKSIAYEDFRAQYEADVVEYVVSNRPIDVSIPYDAAAMLAYEDSDKSMAYDDFKAKYEADTIEMVMSKKVERAGSSEAPAEQVKPESKVEPKVEPRAAAADEEEGSKRLEVALASKPKRDYSTMDVEERAFNILLDLGLISLTPDPDSPDYDSSMDEEFAPENVNI